MDKSLDSSNVYVPSRPSTSTDASQRLFLAKEASQQRAVQSQAFEAALEQIRERVNSESVQTDSMLHGDAIGEHQQDSVQQSTLSADESLDATLPDDQSSGDADAVQHLSDGPGIVHDTDHSDRLQSASVDVALAGTGVNESPAMTSASATGERSTLNGTVTAEEMSLLMRRLERSGHSPEGQWRFTVLDDTTGVSALQLQRGEHGGWQVSVSFDENVMLDEHVQAESLRQSLLEQGHSIDSIIVGAGLNLDDG